MDFPSVAGLLQHLSSDEYKDILNDDDKFEAIFKDIKQIKDWEAEKDMMIASNRSLAEFNLAKESELSEGKQKIIEKSTIGEELCKSIQEKLEDYKKKSSGVSLDTTLALLEAASAQSEEDSDNIAQNFIDGKIDIDKFLEDFTKERIVMHLRKVKVDKMTDLIKNNQNVQPPLFGNPQRPAPYPPYSGLGYPTYMNPVPYPSRPTMPMPGPYGNPY